MFYSYVYTWLCTQEEGLERRGGEAKRRWQLLQGTDWGTSVVLWGATRRGH